MRLGLGMIVKDEVLDLDRILDNYAQYFDEVQITITNESKRKELETICEKYGAVSSYFEWCDDFAKARNFNKEQFKNCDIYFTLDSDDEIDNPEGIRGIADKQFSEDLNIVYLPYIYSKDDHGNVNASHNKERFIKLTDNLYWNKRIHENVLPKSTVGHKTVIDKTVSVTHLRKPGDAEEHFRRNLKYLLQEYSEDGEKTDPRTLAYLGRSFLAIGVHDQAIHFLQKHIERSGWDEDRYKSWCDLAEVFRQKQDYNRAKSAAFEALQECENFPDAYLRLHDIYLEEGDYQKAIHWGKIGLAKKVPDTFMVTDPSSYTWRPALSLSFCYSQIGDFESACALLDYAKKLAPELDFIKNNEGLYRTGRDRKQFVDKFLWMYKCLTAKGGDVTKLIESVPQEYKNHDVICSLRNRHKPIKKWSDKSVAIYCGSVFEEWAPPSVETGIGGSEEAVIYLSKELNKLGYEVTVFNECGQMEGDYNGVKYINNYEFNARDEFNVLISWRTNLFKFPVKAKHKWVWLHDVPQAGWFSEPSEIAALDKIIVLTEYHKSLLNKDVPEEKILVSSNGINLEDFDVEEVREPHRIIYASSYDRGLQYLLEMWEDIRKEVPDAELHVYYGLDNIAKVAKQDPVFKDFYDQIKIALAQDGVTDHGRVGHKELVREFKKASIWAYPTDFPEINCITAMKAQACGAIPVCTDYAALSETVKAGVVIPGKGGAPDVDKNFKQALIELLSSTEEQEKVRPLVEKHKDEFSWSNIAKQWASEWK